MEESKEEGCLITETIDRYPPTERDPDSDEINNTANRIGEAQGTTITGTIIGTVNKDEAMATTTIETINTGIITKRTIKEETEMDGTLVETTPAINDKEATTTTEAVANATVETTSNKVAKGVADFKDRTSILDINDRAMLIIKKMRLGTLRSSLVTMNKQSMKRMKPT